MPKLINCFSMTSVSSEVREERFVCFSIISVRCRVHADAVRLFVNKVRIRDFVGMFLVSYLCSKLFTWSKFEISILSYF